jgi:tetratricopeptide (TPR) repeat protein
VGEYEKASEANVLASLADERYIAACRAQGFYPGAYYPHNVHFLWFSRTFEGRSADAIAAANKVADYAASEICGTPKVEAVRQRQVPLLAYARFGKWDDILAAPTPDPENVFDVAMWHYARVAAHAGRGDATAAAQVAEKFRALAASDEIKQLDSPYFPGSMILAVAEAVIDARVAAAMDDPAARIAALERGVKAEDALPYMEPAFWYYPTRQSLAVAYLEAGKYDKAEETFREDLNHNPRNGWSLYGLAETFRLRGDADATRLVTVEFERAWRNAAVTPELTWY